MRFGLRKNSEGVGPSPDADVGHSLTNGAQKDPSEALETVPRHVAIIMDGNGRWAKERGKPRLEGHRRGAATVRTVVEESRRLGVEYLTLFSFSTENWNRATDEVNGLMSLLKSYLKSEKQMLLDNNVALRAVGDLARLPLDVREQIKRTTEETSQSHKMTLVLALSYGGMEDIMGAARSFAEKCMSGEFQPEDISRESFGGLLSTADIPDPELLIRTSGEYRISNFMLWQLAYSEFVFSPKYWPDFNKEDFHQALLEFGKRERRFGTEEAQANSKGLL